MTAGRRPNDHARPSGHWGADPRTKQVHRDKRGRRPKNRSQFPGNSKVSAESDSHIFEGIPHAVVLILDQTTLMHNYTSLQKVFLDVSRGWCRCRFWSRRSVGTLEPRRCKVHCRRVYSNFMPESHWEKPSGFHPHSHRGVRCVSSLRRSVYTRARSPLRVRAVIWNRPYILAVLKNLALLHMFSGLVDALAVGGTPFCGFVEHCSYPRTSRFSTPGLSGRRGGDGKGHHSLPSLVRHSVCRMSV